MRRYFIYIIAICGVLLVSSASLVFSQQYSGGVENSKTALNEQLKELNRLKYENPELYEFERELFEIDREFYDILERYKQGKID